MNTHAIGDKANRIVLNAYRNAFLIIPIQDGELNMRKLLKRRLRSFNPKIIPSVQPTHATSDMYWLYDRIGKSRSNFAYAYKDLYDKSKVIVFWNRLSS